MTPSTLNIVGLSLDIVGAAMLFFYSPPEPEGHHLLLESAPDGETRRRRRHIRATIAYVGLTVLLSGFVLQLIAAIISKV